MKIIAESYGRHSACEEWPAQANQLEFGVMSMYNVSWKARYSELIKQDEDRDAHNPTAKSLNDAF